MAKTTASFVLDDTDLEIIKGLAAVADMSDSAALRLIIREWSRSNDGHITRGNNTVSVPVLPSVGGDSRG